jgi:hypothetical protein
MVSKEAIKLVVDLATTYPTEFAYNSARYFSVEATSAFIKVLSSGKKLLADMAHDGVTEVLTAVCLPR